LVGFFIINREKTFMSYTLVNTGTNPRVVYDRSRRPVSIAPTSTRRGIDLDERTAEQLHKRMQRGSPLRIHGVSVAETEEPSPTGDPPPPTERNVIEVLSDFDNNVLTYPELVSEAKRLLGDRWPGGRPKQDSVLALLRRVAREES
jgi:hypothetical protein